MDDSREGAAEEDFWRENGKRLLVEGDELQRVSGGERVSGARGWEEMRAGTWS